MKRLLAVLLAALMLLTSLSALTVFAADETKVCDCEHTPLIYVFGKQDIFDNPTADDRRVISGYDLNWLKGMVSDGIKLYAKGLLSGNFDAFCDYIVGNFETQYRDFRCLDNGDLPDNGSGVEWSWSEETMRDDHVYENVYSYVYIFDGRQDPLEIADDLHAYVEAVRRVTGHRRVTMLTRCMGTEIALTYLEKYGWEDLDTFFAYSSAALGTTIFSELFAGKVTFDLNSMSNFLGERHQFDAAIDENAPDAAGEEGKLLIRTLLELMQQLNALGMPSKLCDRLFNKIRDEVLPALLKVSFATSPGYWSMVAPQDYEDAKAFIFKDDAAQYAALIERLDAYDARVRRPMRDIMERMKADGVKLCILAKYGFQLIPLTVSQHAQSDDKITLEAQSFGAASADFGETLSDAYIAARTQQGLARYISPDRIVDASTAWFPDETWFVKNIRHNDFPGQIYDLVLRMTHADRQLTVNDVPEFPQFTTRYWENGEDHWVPMTAENMQTEYQHPTLREVLKLFFQVLRTWLRLKLVAAFQK